MEFQCFNQNPKLCVLANLRNYITNNKDFRNNEDQLFISYQHPHKPVSKSTIARLYGQVMSDADIDVKNMVPTALELHQHYQRGKRVYH